MGNVKHAGVTFSKTLISRLKGEKHTPGGPDGAAATVSTLQGPSAGANARGLRQRVSAPARSTAVHGSGKAHPGEGISPRASLPMIQTVSVPPSDSRQLALSAGTLQRRASASAEEDPSVRLAEAADLADLIDGEWGGSGRGRPQGLAPPPLPRLSSSGMVSTSGASDSRRPSHDEGSHTPVGHASLPILEPSNPEDVEEGARSSDHTRPPSLKPRHGRNLSKVEEGDLEQGGLQGGGDATAKQAASVAAGQQPQGEVVLIEDIKLEPAEPGAGASCKPAYEPWDAGERARVAEGHCYCNALPGYGIGTPLCT